jgi:tripartite-type tricarboxylate transporter receptor subunit TctC
MVTDIIAGRIQAGVDALPNSLQHIRAGSMRALAVLPTARSAAIPDVPTIGETIPGLEVSTWSGIGVPTGTPAEAIERISRETNAGLADATVRKRLAEVGAVPLPFTPDAMRAMIGRDYEKWGRVVKAAGLKPE